MNQHRIPVAHGDQLHFEPDYRLRFSLAWVVVVGWLIFVLIVYLEPDRFQVSDWDPWILQMVVRFGTLFILGSAIVYLRGQYLCIDKRAGTILIANGFSGWVFGWNPVGEFKPDGIFRFQNCQAELQALCVMSYQAPGSQDWLVLYVYTNAESASQAADVLRRWEPNLIVTEEIDQGAVETARTVKALVG